MVPNVASLLLEEIRRGKQDLWYRLTISEKVTRHESLGKGGRGMVIATRPFQRKENDVSVEFYVLLFFGNIGIGTPHDQEILCPLYESVCILFSCQTHVVSSNKYSYFGNNFLRNFECISDFFCHPVVNFEDLGTWHTSLPFHNYLLRI
jgi:hypothetical protein